MSGPSAGAGATGELEHLLSALSLTKAARSEDEWARAQAQLVESFLDLDTPRVTPKMLGFLRNSRGVELLASVVTRRASSSVEVVTESVGGGAGSKGGAAASAFKWRRLAPPEDLGAQAYVHLSFEPVPEAEREAEETARRRSYAVMSLLCGLTQQTGYSGQGAESFYSANRMLEEPSDVVREFCRVTCPALVAYLLDGFHAQSRGSLYHVCKILDVLVRLNADAVLQSLLENKKAFKSALECALNYLHYPCVSDLVLVLLCPVPRNTKELEEQRYLPLETTRDAYLRALSAMNVLLMVSEHVWARDAPEQHRAAAAELLQVLVGKYAGMRGCGDILSALVRSPELLGGLIAVACGEEVQGGAAAHGSAATNDADDEWLTAQPPPGKAGGGGGGGGGKKKSKKGKGKGKKANKGGNKKEEPSSEEEEEPGGAAASAAPPTPPKAHALQRDAALDTLRYIIDTSTKKHVPNTEPKELSAMQETASNLVENQMLDISERLHNILDASFDVLCRAMNDPSSFASESLGHNVKHSIYTVKNPFSNYRLELIKVVSTCVAHKPRSLIPKVADAHWRTMTQWFLEYPHCNLYHVQYHELFHALLRTDDAGLPQLMFVLRDCGLLRDMIERIADDKRRKRESVAGHLLAMLNGVRLQAQALAPEHPLNELLKSSPLWSGFQLMLRQETRRLLQPWPASQPSHFMAMSPAYTPQKLNEIQKLVGVGAQQDAASPEEPSIDLGSPYADGLGFIGVEPFDPQGQQHGEANAKKKGKKGRKA